MGASNKAAVTAAGVAGPTVAGLAGSTIADVVAPCKKAGIRRTENAAVAIILVLDLIAASRIARRDSDSISSLDKLTADTTYRTPHRPKLAEVL
jgi:hypothetical protein